MRPVRGMADCEESTWPSVAMGAGATQVTDPNPSLRWLGIAAEGKAQSAYRAYLDHMRDCEECPQSLFQCETAASLWGLYREARG